MREFFARLLHRLQGEVAKPLFHADLNRIMDEFPNQSTVLDVYMCYRLMLGRRPELKLDCLRKRADFNDLRDLTYGFIRAEEFRNRWETAGLEITGKLDTNVLPEVPVMAQLTDFKLWFYLSDRIVGWGALQNVYESDLAAAIRGFVKPGMFCCDLGANIGYFSLMMAHAGADVYAFEPFPKNYVLLQRNIEENCFGGQIMAFQTAVTDKSGSSRLFVDSNESDYVAMFVPALGDSSEGFREVEIQTVELDQVVPKDRTVSCIKMDIEGSEPLAVRGMSRILSRDKPRIFFEFNSRAIHEHSGRKPAELLESLMQVGYRITTLSGESFVASNENELVNLVAACP